MKKEKDEKVDFKFFYLNKTQFVIPFVESGLVPPIDF